jgi:hypothetical protein
MLFNMDEGLDEWSVDAGTHGITVGSSAEVRGLNKNINH